MAAVISIKVETSGGLDDVKKDVAELGRTAEKEGGGGFSAMQEIATGALRQIGAAVVNIGAAAFAKFGEVIGDSISAAKESNMVAAQTAQVIKSTGSAAGVTADHVLDYASALSAASGKSLFGDEQIAQSTNLLLTFSEIKGATLDAATAISVDMAQALGGAPKDAAIQLGKALNDPVKGITALTRVGVTFSEEQKATIKALQETGDTAGAQAIILEELNKEFGGSAAAAAAADGGFAQFHDRLGEMEETIGKALLPVLGQLMSVVQTTLLPIIESAANTFSAFMATLTAADDPIGVLVAAVDQFSPVLGTLVGAIGDFIMTGGQWQIAVDDLSEGFQIDLGGAINSVSSFVTGTLVPAFQAVWTVLQTQVWPILQDLGTALLPLVGAAVQVLAGFWSDVLLPELTNLWTILTTVVLPILAALAGWLKDNLPGAIQAVADFLTNTLFPALHSVYDFIAVNVIPILQLVAQWLIENVPVAIQAASDFFNNTLVPALNAVWTFIQNNILPIFATVAMWLQANLPVAIQTVSDFWNNTLLPALRSIWTFLQTYIIPIITALIQIHLAALGLAVRTLTAIWTNELLPALTKIWQFVSATLGPIITWLNTMVVIPLYNSLKDMTFFVLGGMIPFFENLAKTLSGTVQSAFNTLSGVAGNLSGALHTIGDYVSGVISKLNDLASTINSIHVPDFLQGHSPPPLANWFGYIADSVAAVNAQLPTMAMNLTAQLGPQGQSIATSTSSRSFTYAPQISTTGNVSAPMDMALANSLAGV